MKCGNEFDKISIKFISKESLLIMKLNMYVKSTGMKYDKNKASLLNI